MTESQTSYIQKLLSYQPDEKVIMVYRPTMTSSWGVRCYFKDKEYDEARLYNHRTILTNEIVIEFDDNDPEKNKKWANDLKSVLLKERYSMSLWWSGNKSYHLHIFVTSLGSAIPSVLKETFIEFYTKKAGTPYPDMQLCNNNHLIRCEFGVHEKTQNHKTLVWKSPEFPKPSPIQKKVWDTYQRKRQRMAKKQMTQVSREVKDLPGFKFLLNPTNVREIGDGRKRILFVLIHVLKSQYQDNQKEFIKFLQDWYRYASGMNMSPQQIEYEVKRQWGKTYNIGPRYLNLLLKELGKEELIKNH